MAKPYCRATASCGRVRLPAGAGYAGPSAEPSGARASKASMILAELEVFHSRPIAPTRRVALGHRDLPVSPAPGFGGILLGGLVAAAIKSIDPEMHHDLVRLTRQLEAGQRIPQPRLRHRLQVDHVGLNRYRHRLVGDGEELSFDFDTSAAPTPQVLAAIYAAGEVVPGARATVMNVIRKGLAWRGETDRHLVEHLTGVGGAGRWSVSVTADPVAWALGVLGLLSEDRGLRPAAPMSRRSRDRAEIQRRFRELLREAHPDHGGEEDGAAQRIADLTEARRILLAG